MSKSYEIYPPIIEQEPANRNQAKHYCELPDEDNTELSSIARCLECNRWYQLICVIDGIGYYRWKRLRGRKLRRILKEIGLC